MKKFLSIALCLVLVLSCVSVFAAADDDAVKVRVYKINPEHYYEGCICIYTSERGEVLGTEGQSFAYWAVVVFEEDAASGGYKCTATYPLSGDAKSDVAIPENGFILAGNTGNDWPALFATANGSEWYYNDSNEQGVPYSECPNYATDHVKKDLEVIASIKVGDIMYLDGVDLGSENLNTNEDEENIFYYSDNYESFAYVSSEKPAPVVDESSEASAEESSKEESKDEEIKINVNTTGWTHVDGTSYGVWQGDAEPVGEFWYNSGIVSGKYVVEVVFKGELSGTDASYGNGNGTNIRLWFHSDKNAAGEDQKTYNCFMDISYNGADVISKLTKNTTADGNTQEVLFNYETAAREARPYTIESVIPTAKDGLYVKLVMDEVPNTTGDVSVLVTVSNKPGDKANNALYAVPTDSVTAEDKAAIKPYDATWKSEYTVKFENKATDPTSDSGIIALAVIASLAAAGAVIVKKSR